MTVSTQLPLFFPVSLLYPLCDMTRMVNRAAPIQAGPQVSGYNHEWTGRSWAFPNLRDPNGWGMCRVPVPSSHQAWLKHYPSRHLSYQNDVGIRDSSHIRWLEGIHVFCQFQYGTCHTNRTTQCARVSEIVWINLLLHRAEIRINKVMLGWFLPLSINYNEIKVMSW